MKNKLLSALMSSKAYPHVTSDIELIETHISYVFVTGSFVYKIKKELDLDFVDYSTLDKRHFFCQEEIRLNRRYAPNYYLGVSQITLSDDGTVAMDGQGEVIEYAVKMKQFPPNSVLSDRMSSNIPEPAFFTDLGISVADFHLSLIKSNAPIRGIGPWRIWEDARENFITINKLISEIKLTGDDEVSLTDIYSWSMEEFKGLIGAMEKREEEGHILDCHGDLHLGNVIIVDEKPILFDGIEFSESLRHIDTLSEIAFVIADLEYYGAFSEATAFLNSYLEITGDYKGLELLRFYKCYRALVRAKVALIKYTQTKDADSYQSFLAYCRLANTYTSKKDTRLFITHGISGSGKTTVAKEAANRFLAIHIRSDILRKQSIGIKDLDSSQSGLNSDLYSEAARGSTYDELFKLSERLLLLGFNVVVDASFLKKAERDRFITLAQQTKSTPAILDCPISRRDAIERVKMRKNDASEATQEVVEYQLEHQDPLSQNELSLRYSIAQ